MIDSAIFIGSKATQKIVVIEFSRLLEEIRRKKPISELVGQLISKSAQLLPTLPGVVE